LPRRKLLSCIAVILSIFCLLSGCGKKGSQETGAVHPPAAIKCGGSSTLAPVISKCADNFTEKYKTWDKVRPQLPPDPIIIFVSTGGSDFGVKGVLDGVLDIGLASREIKPEEREKMPEGKIFKVGVDALAIAVHPQNPIIQVKPSLTPEELKKIFSGEIKKWKEIDPRLPDRPIVVCVRDVGGGAAQVFDELVMKGTPVSKEALQLPSMGALASKVMENVDAIGYVSTGLIAQNPGKLKPLQVEGVDPTRENILAGKYKLARPLLMFTRGEPDERQQLFIDYVLSPEGQKVIEEMGFIPVAR